MTDQSSVDLTRETIIHMLFGVLEPTNKMSVIVALDPGAGLHKWQARIGSYQATGATPNQAFNELATTLVTGLQQRMKGAERAIAAYGRFWR